MAVTAGDVFTAHGYNLAKPVYAYKTVSESVTNSITDQLDDELFLPLEPFSIYVVRACYSVTGSTTGDLRLGYAVPTGAQGRRHNLGLSANVTATSGNMRISVHGWPTAVTYGTTTTAVSIIEEGVIFTEAAGGLLQTQWAQNVADATATTLAADSFLTTQRVI
jgi:hypothetical protein